MKLLISYFYKIRFFSRDMIPLSTAVWDPKWFHGEDGLYIDKRGVINGCRFEHFMPGPTCNNLCRGSENCKQEPTTCSFLKEYRKQLDKLNFTAVMQLLQKFAVMMRSKMNLDHEPTLVFMVYEPPYKLCSERVPLVAWFKEHGYDLAEFDEHDID